MVALRNSLWLWFTLAAILIGLPAYAATEEGAFNAAEKAFADRFFARAESEFAAFVQKYTNSSLIPEAVLRQGQARIEQTNYEGALKLLEPPAVPAGKWADQYLFSAAVARMRSGDYQKAAADFARVVKDFPASNLRVEAAITETTVRARLGQWPQIVELLSDTNGVFQNAVRANGTNDLAVRGYLLLSEANLAQGNYAGAESALRGVDAVVLGGSLAWQREYLRGRILFAQGKYQEAFTNSARLLTLATNTAQRPLLADTFAFQASLLERLGRGDVSMDVYERNLEAGTPPDRQRQALLKIAELALARNRIPRATQVLEKFCSQYKDAPSRDLALLTYGELRLRQYVTDPTGTNALTAAGAAPATSTNALTSTNHLVAALAAFQNVIAGYPQSTVLGKAELDLGWCLWLTNKLADARVAFGAAVEHLPASSDQATALFKLADTDFRLGDFRGAASNYWAVVNTFGNDASVRTNLFEPALYQLVRCGIAENDTASAENALRKLLEWYPTGFHTERAVLLEGEAVAEKGNPAKARETFIGFAEKAPGASLMPQLRLAIARTYEREQKWDLMIGECEDLLKRFTNAPSSDNAGLAVARAEYLRAWANFQAGRETNAVNLFTNFIAHFPKDSCAPLAQWWIADYYFRTERWAEAEVNFQLLYDATKWPEALLMAGRTAFARAGWKDATNYFTRLTSDPKCPRDVWAQAMFAYGSTLMSRDNNENKAADYAQAIGYFNQIAESLPTNQIAVLALGEKAACLFQWAQSAPQMETAAVEFQKVITNRLADSGVRAIARVGYGTVLERQAQSKAVAEQGALLRKALDSYLDAYYYEKDLRDGEKPDFFWVKEAGLKAAKLAESLQEWDPAVKIYAGLCRLLPALRPSFEKKLAKAQENLVKSKS